MIIFGWNILSDVLNLAVEDAAEVVDGLHTDVLAILKSGQCAEGHSVLSCQGIPVFAGSFQSIPERLVTDHL